MRLTFCIAIILVLAILLKMDNAIFLSYSCTMAGIHVHYSACKQLAVSLATQGQSIKRVGLAYCACATVASTCSHYASEKTQTSCS